MIESITRRTLIDSLLLGSVVFVVLWLVLWRLFRRSLQPLQLLIGWSQRIKTNPEGDNRANFSISEVNEIAEQLLASLDRVKAYNEREQQFLKHASHELRTPLAIVQASLDTLGVRINRGDPSRPALERATRASGHMIQLSETLLWLARDSEQSIPKTRLSPERVCEEIMADLDYLLANKAVEVVVRCNIEVIEIEQELFRIVLANVIRNAFQYTQQGEIRVQLGASSITVHNSVQGADSQVVSFGLGLQLVERIAKKLHWQFSFDLDEQSATVTLSWSSSPATP